MAQSYKLVYPDINKNSIVNLMASILANFGVNSPYSMLDKNYFKNINSCEKLIFFCIDGFGLNIWKKYAIKYSLFKTLQRDMDKQSITSLFPSTTSAALTTMHTGVPPKVHGIFEWNMYFKELNAVISPLPYQTVSPIYDSISLSTYKNDPGILIDIPTIYEKLLLRNVKSYISYPKQFAKGTYNNEAFRGAESKFYTTLSDLLIGLKEKLESTRGQAYFFVYWPFLDKTEHLYGPFTQQTDIHIKMLNDTIQRLFIKNIDNNLAKNVGLIISSDHGQIACHPENINYINKIRSVQSFFRKTPTGKLILPSGNVRDMFLHIRKAFLLKCYVDITEFLKNKADVLILDKVAINKLFGNSKAHLLFYDRLGDLLILPKTDALVGYQYLPTDRFIYKGTHGGLTEDEMMIPLVANRLSALR